MRTLFIVSTTVLLSGCITDPSTATDEPRPAVDAGQRLDGGQISDGAPGTDLGFQPDARLQPDRGPRDAATIPDAATPDDPCSALCDRVAGCLDLEAAECERLCPNLAPERHACVLDAPECRDVRACFEEPNRPGPAEICNAVCERQAGCVDFVCAPGTLPAEWQETCQSACLAQPPEQAEIQQLFAALCGDVVSDLRATDEAIDARCDAEAEVRQAWRKNWGESPP